MQEKPIFTCQDPTLFATGDEETDMHTERRKKGIFHCPLNGLLLNDTEYQLIMAKPNIPEAERIRLMENIGYKRTGEYY